MTARRLVLFDIDGTLLLTAGAGRRAIREAVAELVGDTDFDRVRFDGKTDPQIIVELLEMAGHEDPREPERLGRIARHYLGMLRQELARPTTVTTVMPGVTALLDELERQAGVVLGLLTGNFIEGAELKLRAGGLEFGRFRVGAFGSDSPHRPELPPIAARRAEPLFGRVPVGDEVVIIGDTPADVTCGRGIGARAVAVATGAFSLAELEAHGPHALFGDLSDTARVLDAILA